jgi:2-C-methyl-D-erythritol 4-phosphate cytidylyltransferase
VNGDPGARPLRALPVDREEVTALVLGAGLGLRMCLGPKAFIRLKDVTLLELAVHAVIPFAAQVVVGVCIDDEARTIELLQPLMQSGRLDGMSLDLSVHVGGATRQETVSLLASQARRRLVLLHEVARPHVTPELFARVLAGAAEVGGAALFLPLEARDSVATVRDGCIEHAMPRSSVVTLQTPHAYRRDWLIDAHARGAREAWKEEGTAGLVRRAGHPVKLVPGSPDNLKLTFQADLPADAEPRQANAREVN